MINIKKIIVSIIALATITTNTSAWEVTTHQQLTRMAVISDDRSENLKYFVRTFDLGVEDYSDEGNVTLFWGSEESTGSYIFVAEDLTGRPAVRAKLAVDINLNGNYIGLIEAGSILEDTIVTNTGINYTHARYVRHFYDPHEDECYGLHIAGGTLVGTCARIWALNGDSDPDMDYNLAQDDNNFSWVEAYNYYFDSILAENNEDRRLAQASLFVSMGFLSHLIEDMAQAAHTRNDMHGGAFYAGGTNVFEIWADEHFNTRNQNISFPSGEEMNPLSFGNHFNQVASFTHDNFFSDDTFPWHVNYGGHPLPATTNVTEEEIYSETDWINTTTYYLLSTGLDIPDGTRLGFHVDINWWRDRWSLEETIPDNNGNSRTDYSVLEDNARIIFPHAINAAEGLINFFFRARIIASLDAQNSNKLVVKNITRQNVVNPQANVQIQNGATIYIYYETVNGKRLPLPDIGLQSLQQNLDHNESITIEGLSDAINEVNKETLPEDIRICEQKTIIVLIDGTMGGNDPLEDRVIAASKFVFTENASVLLTFDTSGSMGDQIEYVKDSGLSIVPLLSGGENNYMAVYSFDDGVYSNQVYTNNFSLVQSAITSLYSDGSTSLYDAIIISGEHAAQHKLNYQSNKSIIVLYTDGIENDSVNSKQTAVNAISKVTHPEIDEVFLVFIDTGDDSGRQDLEDIADQSGRNFLYLTDPEQLASELMSILH